MELLLPPAPAPVPGLLLHRGGVTATRDDVFTVETPPPTDTWYPLSHRSLVQEIQSGLVGCGFRVEGESHALSHEGARYFGVFAISLPSRPENGVGWVVGVRNSHDKQYPAGLVVGTTITVCDNLCFSGEVRLSRKHTRHAARDLSYLMSRAIGELGGKLRKLDDRIAAYREHALEDREVHDLIVRSIDNRVITPTQVPDVLHEWRQPRHEEFQPRTLWSLWNAYTEVFKGGNPHIAVRRGQALHGLCEGVLGLAS
ncbi:DUF932 domain-containing protein [Luteolibacter sp. LG18]|uniref:DUF932 domain-containing protein n=1 Tax=Luteolibacter sp. LG18 TaxID=2819286 RepID=UPI002B2B5D37|nr:hypothetical protein llg_22840 [Luteolibacter sp. LG18]BCU79597.1 hypothetical protein llg_43120 [Luteolibacter sp. LG18]